MILAFKGAAKGGDSTNIDTGQIQITIQIHGKIPAVAVKDAVFSEGEKILQAADVQFLPVFCCQSREREGCHQRKAQQ